MKRSQLAAVAMTGLMLMPGAVWAETVPVPEGCTPIATALKTSCHATTLLDCGATREAHTFRDGEPIVVHVYTPEWEMTEFRFAAFSGARMTAVPGTGANTELDVLLDSGRSEESGSFLMNTPMIEDRPFTMRGHIDLTDETPELGGIPFRKARMYRSFEREPGDGNMSFELDIYVAPESDLFIEGSWTRSVRGGTQEAFDQTPYHVAMPGETGFLAVRSEQGCE